MRVRNKTNYSTSDLRKFFRAGLKAMGASTDKWIAVFPSKTGRIHGRACVGDYWGQGDWINMWLPRNDLVTPLTVARVFEHEVAHNLGVRHEDMSSEVYFCRQEVTWHEGLEIRYIEPVKMKVDHVAKREAHARKMMERWEKKLRLAKTHLRKWTKKVKYYERRAAAGEERS